MDYPQFHSSDKTAKTVDGLSNFYGNFPNPTILALKKRFLDHSQYDKGYSPETIIKYNDCLQCFVKSIGDLEVNEIQIDHFIQVKKRLMQRAVGDARIASIVFAMKSFLRYCREVLEQPCLDPSKIKSPKRLKREVVYLTNEEIEQFRNAIKIYNKWDGKQKSRKINIQGLRFRTLVEVLLGTGMRISEALSLNINSISFEEGEAKIIGKGDKERTIYFSRTSLWWIKKYLASRSDNCKALFVTHPHASRLKRADIWRYFSRSCQKAGLKKKVSAHILRHTFATNMLYNGCDLITIKEILGHHDISITARAYIGIDKRKIKENHSKYLNYNK